MSVWQILGLLLGSSGLTKLVDVLLDRLKRRDTVEDRKVAEGKSYTMLDKKLDEFISTQSAVNTEMADHMQAIDDTLRIVLKSSKAIQYASLWSEAMAYIKQGSISPEARVTFKAKVREYHEMFDETWDDFADIMAEIDDLKN